MNIFLALFLLGLLQGLTEFLPVSSSGHLVLFSKIFGIEESLFLSIFLHVATLLSIIVVFHKDIWQIIRHPFSKYTINLFIATIPTCIIALILMPVVKLAFVGSALPVCFAISAVLLLLTDILKKKKPETDIDASSAFLIGIAQGFAIFPGISRSGSTISAGLLAGKRKGEVAKFSFLMSIPIIFLSLILEIYDCIMGKVVFNLNIGGLILSFITAFLVGIFAIKATIKLTEKANLKYFSFYLAFISIFSLFFV